MTPTLKILLLSLFTASFACVPLSTEEVGSSNLLTLSLKAPAKKQLQDVYGERCENTGNTDQLDKIFGKIAPSDGKLPDHCENLLSIMDQYSLEIVSADDKNAKVVSRQRQALKANENINTSITEGTKYVIRMNIHWSKAESGSVFEGSTEITEEDYQNNIRTIISNNKEFRVLDVTIKLVPAFIGLQLGLDPKKEVETDSAEDVEIELDIEFDSAATEADGEKNTPTAPQISSERMKYGDYTLNIQRKNGTMTSVSFGKDAAKTLELDFKNINVGKGTTVVVDSSAEEKMTFTKNAKSISIVLCENKNCLSPTGFPIQR